MESVVSDVLDGFAADTKHKRVTDPAQLVKKLLATQCPGKRVNWKNVYHHVSDDAERIEYMAPGALDIYAENVKVPFEFFQTIFDDNRHAVGSPIIEHFADAVDVTDNKTAWFFCANMCTNDTEKTLEHLKIQCDGDGIAANNMYTAMAAYFNDEHNALDETKMGEWIAGMEFDDLPFVNGIGNGKRVVVDEIDEKNNEPEYVTQKIVFAESDNLPLTWTTDTERKFRQNDTVKSYKIENDLPTRSQNLPIVKKLILDDDQLLDVVDYFTQDTVDALVETPQATDFYLRENWKKSQHDLTKQEFIKKMLVSQPWGQEIKTLVEKANVQRE